jgi:hypothetical protein
MLCIWHVGWFESTLFIRMLILPAFAKEHDLSSTCYQQYLSLCAPYVVRSTYRCFGVLLNEAVNYYEHIAWVRSYINELLHSISRKKMMGQHLSDRRKRCHKTSLCATKPLHGLTREPTRASEGEKPATDRLSQRFPNCGPRTTGGPWVLPLWSF